MYRQNNTMPYLTVGVMEVPTDMSTFVPVDTVSVSQSSVSEVHWEAKSVLLDTYTGNGRFIAFRYQGMSAAYLDSLVVRYADVPDPQVCNAPTQLTVSGVTDSSAVVAWTDEEASAWMLAYRMTGGGYDSLLVTETTCTLQNLSDSTTYEVRVKALCDSALSSEWSESVQLTTLHGSGDGIADYQRSRLRVCPNPADEYVEITFLSGESSMKRVTLFDGAGRTVRSQKAGTDRVRVSLEGLSSGVYVLQVEAGGEVSRHKVLKR